MSKMKLLYSLRLKHVAYSIGLTVFLSTLAGSAYASDSQVVIVNGTANHCLPYPSCYKPYEIDVQPGGTVTWVNSDNKAHTATAGTPNYGPVGMFDSGTIPPGHSYTQFFGTIGKYPYYDQTDMWPSGVVVVSNQGPTHAEIGWVNGSLSMTSQVHNDNQKLILTKQIENTGGTDANSVIFRLRILNDSGFLFYDDITSGNVPARKNSTVSFTSNNPQPGNYRLNFNSENLPGQINENNEVSSDLISVSKPNASQPESVVAKNFTVNDKNVAVPEFGPLSLVVLVVSIVSVLMVSARSSLFKT